MYRGKDRKTMYLFKELFPFGGKLDEKNRWLRIAELIPWEGLEKKYASYFSEIGRPGLDGRLVVGLFLLKHMTGISDEEVVLRLQENPYWQAFCGFDNFATGSILDDSSLTKLRKRLGVRYFRELEELTYQVLIERRIIKSKGMLVDGTVFGENVKYPNDVSLLNDAREWLVGQIKELGKRIGKQYRTYCRKAKSLHVSFSKSKQKTKKKIGRVKRQMLQYVRRNIEQMEEILELMDSGGKGIKEGIRKRLKVAAKIYGQQYEMYKKKAYRISDRIVSFHRPYVRPIKRGKNGKDVEFGPKGALSDVDGFLFLDMLSHDNFSEAGTEIVSEQIGSYERRFNKRPPWVSGDRLYGSRTNRGLLAELGIRSGFVRLGRKKKEASGSNHWIKQKQKERNRIEGDFGRGKEHYGLDRIQYEGKDGAEMWVRAVILGMNLKTAMARI